MNTNLKDPENNLKLLHDDIGKIQLSNVIECINFRILKHKEFIKKHQIMIARNIDFINIITDEANKINERKAKIEELRELIKHSLS